MTEQLSGVIERITFHNLETGYCVLRVRARGQREMVTVVGEMQHPIAGEYVEAAGKWITDRQFGLQFKADNLKATPPHTAEGIVKYLGSGLVRGVGPGFARRIVDVFGDKTLEVIDQSPTFLSQVKGIGPKLIEKIRDSWREQQAVRSIMVFLHSYGIGTARAVRIYREYGENAIEVVKQNPYRLSTDIWGVGFQTADALALKLGLPRDSPFRAQAAVRHVLSEAQSDGHVGLPEELATQAAEALTQIPPDGIRDAVEQLRITDEIVRDSVALVTKDTGYDPDEAAGVPGDEHLLYLKPLFLAELGVARQLAALAKGTHPLRTADHAAALGWAEQKMGITFADSQRKAITEAVTHKLMVVTGGPGTGKTTIVRAILEIVSAKSLRVLLAAPTGRAAKRLAESTGREAKTIHRLLEFDPGIGGFRRGKENPLDVDVLVVDEVSMVDVVLMNQLLRAVPPFAAIVFVGDVDQLPSVGAGSVLADLIESRVLPVARLTEVHRQAGASWIVRAAHAVNHGDQPESAPAGKGDFYFVEADAPEAVIDRIRQAVTARIPAAFGLDPLKDVQVLTPQVKTELGVLNLNRVLQEALNPPRPGVAETKKFDTTFRAGDKVMQVRNNYQREVFNGDIGRVAAIDAVDQTLTVDFDGKPVAYDFADLDELQLAFAISVHKSQGAEYPAVVVPVSTQHYVMLQRNLLYTAITRGRKLVVLVGSRRALWRAVTTADTRRRFGLLRWRLRAQLAGKTAGEPGNSAYEQVHVPAAVGAGDPRGPAVGGGVVHAAAHPPVVRRVGGAPGRPRRRTRRQEGEVVGGVAELAARRPRRGARLRPRGQRVVAEQRPQPARGAEGVHLVEPVADPGRRRERVRREGAGVADARNRRRGSRLVGGGRLGAGGLVCRLRPPAEGAGLGVDGEGGQEGEGEEGSNRHQGCSFREGVPGDLPLLFDTPLANTLDAG